MKWGTVVCRISIRFQRYIQIRSEPKKKLYMLKCKISGLGGLRRPQALKNVIVNKIFQFSSETYEMGYSDVQNFNTVPMVYSYLVRAQKISRDHQNCTFGNRRGGARRNVQSPKRHSNANNFFDFHFFETK